MKQNCPLSECIEKLGGNSVVAQALDVVPHSISQAKSAGVFPSSWFVGMKELADTADFDLSTELFNFRTGKPRSSRSEGASA